MSFKKVKRYIRYEKNEISDLFLAGSEAVKKISLMAYTRKFEELTNKESVRIIKKNMRHKKKRLVVF